MNFLKNVNKFSIFSRGNGFPLKKFSQSSSREYPEILKLLFEKNIKNKKLPSFEVYSSQIEILNQPMDFYLAILVNLKIINL